MIFTFYSFKGGVGRSMAMANIAEIMYRRGLRVLLVDFDLEAPGLERYFSLEVDEKHGVIDLLSGLKRLRSLSSAHRPSFRKSPAAPVLPIEDYVLPIYAYSESGGCLDLLPAGNRSNPDYAAYAKRVLEFDWRDFYVNCDGQQYFEWFRQELKGRWDVVLIDSRTGVTEMGGVCTHQLADAVVLFVATNVQNLEGTLMMAKSLTDSRLTMSRGNEPLKLVFVPSRVELSEQDRHDEFANEFNERLGRQMPGHVWEQNPFVDLKLPYVPAHAYKETVAVRDPNRASNHDLINQYQRLCFHLGSLADPENILAQVCLAAEGHQYIARLERTLACLTQADRTWMREVISRLAVHGGELGVDAQGLDHIPEGVLGALLGVNSLLTCTDDRFRLAEQTLPSTWVRARGWLTADRELIEKRSELQALTRAWVEAGRVEDGLLAPEVLDSFLGFFKEHPMRLNSLETRFLEESFLRSLRRRDFASNPVFDLSPLSTFPKMETLNLAGTSIVDLTPLSTLTALRDLDLSSSPITDIRPLGGLVSLRYLDLSFTRVADIERLSGLTALESLNLRDTSVDDVAAIAALVSLRHLVLSSTRVVDLGPLACLSALRFLDLDDTLVSDLAGLADLSALTSLHLGDTQVSDLAPLARLSALHTLNLRGTQVSNLAPLAALSALHTLDLCGTQVSDLAPLAALSALHTLNLRGTQVSNLTPLAALSALHTLDLCGTEVSDLAPLTALSCLHTLDLSGTQVSDLAPLRPMIAAGLSVRWSAAYWEGPGIYVDRCPLTNPPPEIVQQGNQAILNYWQEKAVSPVDHLYEAKMLILGEGGSGKTSLLRRLYQPGQPLPEESQTTKGIDIHPVHFEVDGKPFRLNVWDFGGQEIYHATHQFFLTRRSLYLLLDDTKKDHKSVSDDGFKYWLDLVDVFGGRSPVLIFQNEKGGRSKQIDLAGIKGVFENVKDKFEGNLEYENAAEKLKKAIAFHASQLPHIGEELPARWLDVRAELETRARQVPYISEKEYCELYSRHLPADPQKARFLSQYFHDLGVCLHFQDDDLLQRTVILQNDWATGAVFRILDDEAINKKARFTEADLARVWNSPQYEEMRPELLSLMKRFEICYELPDAKPRTWLVPQLLPPTKPIRLQDWNQPGDLVLRYRYDFLPKGTISRLTVRQHRFVKNPDLAWTTGVLLERGRDQVLTEILANKEIELRARGPEAKELLTIIANDLDALNESIPGLRDKVDQRIPCPCATCAPSTRPHFYSKRHLLRRKEHGRREVECEVSYQSVNVQALLDGLQPRRRSSSPTRPLRYFLSYARKNTKDVEALLNVLDDELGQGFERWRDSDNILPGEKWHDEIQAALRDADFGLLLLSPAFFQSDYIQQHELDQLLDKEMILPVALHHMDNWQSLSQHQVFRDGKDRAFDRCRLAAARRDFARELRVRIEALLAKRA